MADRIEFIVEGDVGELSANRRLHPLARARLVKMWRTKGYLYAKQVRREPFALKVRISYTVYRARAMDDDNLAGSLALKAIRDSLIEAGLVIDDAPQYVVMGEVKQVVAPEYKAWPKGLGPQVVVTIEEVKD